jgi:hypothetical protein
MTKVRSTDRQTRSEGVHALASLEICTAVASNLVLGGALQEICEIISEYVAQGTSGDALCVQLYSVMFKIGAMSEFCRQVAEALSRIMATPSHDNHVAHTSMVAPARSGGAHVYASMNNHSSAKGSNGAYAHRSMHGGHGSSHVNSAELARTRSLGAPGGRLMMSSKPAERMVGSTYIYTCMHACIHAYILWCKAHTYTHKCTHRHVQVVGGTLHATHYIHSHTHTHTLDTHFAVRGSTLKIYTYIQRHITCYPLYTFTHTYTHTHT